MKTVSGDRFEAYSAGAKPSFVHPLAIKVMAEKAIDISNQKSKSVADFSGQEFDFVITLCGDYAQDVCPLFVGKVKRSLHWNLIDPAEAQGSQEERLKAFRLVRDQIITMIEEFVKEAKELKDE